MTKKTIKDLSVKGKTVLVRVDFNVPMQSGRITDDKRIVAALETIQYLIDHQAKVVLFSHLGKIKQAEDIENPDRDLQPVARRLAELLDQEVTFCPQTRGSELESAIQSLKEGEVVLVQNTRFEDLDGKKESKNDEELGKYWASLGDLFVNDAFGTAHRAHASNVGIAQHLESAIGFLMEKEVQFLGEAVDQPKRPFVAILGGAKVSDKIKVIENLIQKADKIIIGGGMAYTFFKAKGWEIGQSICEDDRLAIAKEILEQAGDKLVLPVDTVVAKEFSNEADHHVVPSNQIPAEEMGMDIGPKSIELFTETLQDAATVVWNGPMGVFEMANFAKGTVGLCRAIAQLQDATTIVGGGDSAAAVSQLGFEDQFTHISTGGGASLTYLEGSELPGLVAIDDL
ncbi:phosphoglycerate kinase [Facklamia languida]